MKKLLICFSIAGLVFCIFEVSNGQNKPITSHTPKFYNFSKLSKEVEELADLAIKAGDQQRAKIGYEWVLLYLPEAPSTRETRNRVDLKLKKILKDAKSPVRFQAVPR